MSYTVEQLHGVIQYLDSNPGTVILGTDDKGEDTWLGVDHFRYLLEQAEAGK